MKESAVLCGQWQENGRKGPQGIGDELLELCKRRKGRSMLRPYKENPTRRASLRNAGHEAEAAVAAGL